MALLRLFPDTPLYRLMTQVSFPAPLSSPLCSRTRSTFTPSIPSTGVSLPHSTPSIPPAPPSSRRIGKCGCDGRTCSTPAQSTHVRSNAHPLRLPFFVSSPSSSSILPSSSTLPPSHSPICQVSICERAAAIGEEEDDTELNEYLLEPLPQRALALPPYSASTQAVVPLTSCLLPLASCLLLLLFLRLCWSLQRTPP